MELVGAAHGIILNDPHLREGLIRDSERARPRRPKQKRNFRIRRWLALALHGLASRIDPAVRAHELRSGDAFRNPMTAGELP
jgi:hypothetical protein